MQQHQQQSRLQSLKRIKKKKHQHQQQQHERTRIWAFLILVPFVLILSVWLLAVVYVMILISPQEEDNITSTTTTGSNINNNVVSVNSMRHPSPFDTRNNSDGGSSNLRKRITSQQQQQQQQQQPRLLSRNPKVTITTSARGNLGPSSVLNQDPPGSDWIKDRWQAASDMHGTAIRGSHWVLFDFTQLLLQEEEQEEEGSDGRRRGIQMTKIVLDWETAFAKDYRIEGRMIMDHHPTDNNGDFVDSSNNDWCVLYDSGDKSTNNDNSNNEKVIHTIDHYPKRTEEEYGQSPGVKQKLPLHIIHTIEWTTAASTMSNEEQRSNSDGSNNANNSATKQQQNTHRGSSSTTTTTCQTTSFQYLRIFIRKSVHGWGVSLWEVDVYGYIHTV
ncbi:hypothetical protein ACHAWC_011215 [Mediolabrus comicus]